jgi:nicotinate-nucleotide adenylyltransferase
MRTDFSNLYGVFGGAFSPITNAHIFIAGTVIEELKLEKVIFLPVGNIYGKEGLLPQEIRLQLIKDCIFNNPNLDVSDVEIKSPTVLTTADSLRILAKAYPGKNLHSLKGMIILNL